MAKKPAMKIAKKAHTTKAALAKKPAAKKWPAKKPSAKKPSAKKPSAKKPSAKKPSAKKPAATQPAAPAKAIAPAFDWKAASQGSLSSGGKLLAALGDGKPAAQQKAYDELASKTVGRPMACVVAPFLVELAIAGTARAASLRLLAAIRDHAPVTGSRAEQRLTRATDPIVAHVPAFLRDPDPRVRAAAALVAGAFATALAELGELLASESDVRAKTCMILAQDRVATARPLLGDPDPRIATAAACVLARPDTDLADGVLDQLERALADETLDAFPFPDSSLRARALTALTALTQPALRDRLAMIYGRLLDRPVGKLAAVSLMDLAFTGHDAKASLTQFQTTALRMLVESKTANPLLLQRVYGYNLPNRVEALRRMAGIREPVPEGWVLGVEITLDGVTDSGLGFWTSYIQTGVGDARAIADAIAAALPAASCAEAVLEGCKLGTGQYCDHGWTPPPFPDGGVLGAIDNWEDWTAYKTKSSTEVADAYSNQLVADGYHVLGRSDQPTDTRVVAIRDGVEVDLTVYFNDEDGAYANASRFPELFTTFVDAALARHGAAFVDAYNAIIQTTSTPAGKKRVEAFVNVGYWLPKAALLIAQRTRTAPDPAFDMLVATHQRGCNVLLACHMSYLALVPPDRRTRIVQTIISEGKFMKLARETPTPEVLDAAAEGFRRELSSFRSGYDDAFRTTFASNWVFLGDRAVDAIQKALKRKEVGNPDIAAEILLLIGTAAARKALDQLAKLPDKAVQKLVQAALAN